MGKPRKNGTKSRQVALTSGVGLYSKSAMYKKSGKWAKKKQWKNPAKKPAAKGPTKKEFGKGKNAGTRIIPAKRAPKFYPTERLQRKLKNTRAKPRPSQLRSSIHPGQVLILLSGKFRGRHVVFLRQLQPSGLLLVTGPYKANGIPLRRINQAYVIATSTRVDLAGVTIPNHLDDKYFSGHKKAKLAQKKVATTGDLFVEKAKTDKPKIDDKRKADQKAIDDALLKNIAKVPQLKQYLASTFSLHNREFPHELKF